MIGAEQRVRRDPVRVGDVEPLTLLDQGGRDVPHAEVVEQRRGGQVGELARLAHRHVQDAERHRGAEQAVSVARGLLAARGLELVEERLREPHRLDRALHRGASAGPIEERRVGRLARASRRRSSLAGRVERPARGRARSLRGLGDGLRRHDRAPPADGRAAAARAGRAPA